MLGGRHSLIFVCRRPQTSTNLKLRVLAPQGASHVSRAPAYTLLGYPRASIIHLLPYLGTTRLVSGGMWWVRMLCACVPVWHEPESDRGHSCNVKEREREIIMYSKGAFQSPIQWHAIGPHRSSMLHPILIHDNWTGLSSICPVYKHT